MNRAFLGAAAVLLLVGATAPARGGQGIVIDHRAADLPAVARAVEPGAKMRIEGLELDGRPGAVTLGLERFEVFAADIRIVVRGEEQERVQPPPANVYFRGAIVGEADSLVLLTVRENGGMRGLVAKNGRLWMLGGGPESRGPAVGLASRQVDVVGELGALARAWTCGADSLGSPGALARSLAPGSPVLAQPAEAPAVSHTARIAVEADYEFFNKFPDPGNALEYIGDLIAYGSTIYSSEVDTSWVITGEIDVYTSNNDPWTFGDYDGNGKINCADRLYELRDYWVQNHGGVERTVVHMLSGKPTGCGIAYVGALCSNSFGYGFTGGVSGSFDIDNPSAVWDMVAMAHEIGHNFNSPHTHDYCNIGGHPEPVDECVPAQLGPACNGGSDTLPVGCGGSGQGCGTIMSYCHLLSGGMGNISLTLGLGHPDGIQPERVPARMLGHVMSRAASNPACLAPINPSVIFADGFESGDSDNWSRSVPPVP